MGVEHEKWATDVLKHIGVNPEIPAQVIDEEPDGIGDQPDGVSAGCIFPICAA
ncbi:hypothetical protein [Pseudovibrio sp. POLY-S9]|uniref:hypothetical protein n=1 Tax=Pseudovibrio sp. POLY-S9 TaxID=1576596 RepID=UPI000B134F63|nr:hypothetical protein [Pseudovibrio sp. POLY-S9]